jgi:hypothetical protein
MDGGTGRFDLMLFLQITVWTMEWYLEEVKMEEQRWLITL